MLPQHFCNEQRGKELVLFCSSSFSKAVQVTVQKNLKMVHEATKPSGPKYQIS